MASGYRHQHCEQGGGVSEMVVIMSDPGIKSLMRENIYITDIPISVGASKRFILAT